MNIGAHMGEDARGHILSIPNATLNIITRCGCILSLNIPVHTGVYIYATRAVVQ